MAQNDISAQKQALQDQIDLAELNKKLLDATNALAAASDTSKKALQDQIDAANAAKSLADAQKAGSDAQTAQANAKAAAQKAKVPSTDVQGLTGKVDVTGDKVGLLEGDLLATAAVIQASEEIARDVNKALPAAESVLVFAAGDFPKFDTLIPYNAQLNISGAALDRALKMPPLGVGVEGVAEALPAAATVLDSVTKLISFFKSDFTVGGVDVTLDDPLLVNSVAKKLNALQRKVSTPAVFNPKLLAAESPFLKRLLDVLDTRQLAGATATALQSQIDSLTKTIAAETGDQKQADQQKAAAASRKVSALQAANSFVDAILAKLVAIDDKAGSAPLYNIVKEDVLAQMLADGKTHALIVRIQKAGGGYLIKKNLWTFFGAVPLYHMGGAAVSYALYNGATGAFEEGGDIPIDGGFVKKNDLKEFLTKVR